jgi:hypothetical protein
VGARSFRGESGKSGVGSGDIVEAVWTALGFLFFLPASSSKSFGMLLFGPQPSFVFVCTWAADRRDFFTGVSAEASSGSGS